MIRLMFLFVFAMCFIDIAVPRLVRPDWYGKCLRYCAPRKNPPKVSGYQRDCVSDYNCTYCKFFPCPEVSVCSNGEAPYPSHDKICLTCPDECVYLGETYVGGETGIVSVDMVNECVCRGFKPQIVCSKMVPQPTPEVFCEY